MCNTCRVPTHFPFQNFQTFPDSSFHNFPLISQTTFDFVTYRGCCDMTRGLWPLHMAYNWHDFTQSWHPSFFSHLESLANQTLYLGFSSQPLWKLAFTHCGRSVQTPTQKVGQRSTFRIQFCSPKILVETNLRIINTRFKVLDSDRQRSALCYLQLWGPGLPMLVLYI